MQHPPLKVLITDDSAFMRKMFTDILMRDKSIEVVGTAENGLDCIQKIITLKPDVVTLDIEMPLVNGLVALEKIMQKYPLPVIVVSSLTLKGASQTLKAFDLGAADVLAKPVNKPGDDWEHFSNELLEKIKSVSGINIKKLKKPIQLLGAKQEPLTTVNMPKFATELIVIGISTGGPQALQAFLPDMPSSFNVPILVIQHMPAGFTGPLAQRLDAKCKLDVREGADGDILIPGKIYIAPAGKQCVIHSKLGKLSIEITDKATMPTHYKPSVDITLRSIAKEKIKGVICVQMTGMGQDGLLGIKEIKSLGGYVIAQSEESCIIYGMPKAVVDAGLADRIVPLNMVASTLVECVRGR